MTDKALLFVCLYLIGAFILGVLVGKTIKWGQRCHHDWVDKGSGKVCRRCGQKETDPS